MTAREIVEAVAMCDQQGKLSPDGVGWARHPIIACNVKGSLFRKKKWNYWCVTSPQLLFSATISHLDYAAVIFIYALDLATKKFQEKTVVVPFGKGCNMPDEVYASVRYESPQLAIAFEELGGSTSIKVHCPSFGGLKQPFTASLLIERPQDHESLNIVIPWSRERFQFTSKMEALPASGTIHWHEETYSISRTDSYGCLDFGRGKWPYRAEWNWGAASGRADGRTIGLNFGGKWTDGTGQNENGFVVNGRLHKIHEDMIWNYNQQNYMEPWHLETKGSDRVKLRFDPIFERIAATNAVIITSKVHQLIGTYSGYIVDDSGEKIIISNLLGWAEDHAAKW